MPPRTRRAQAQPKHEFANKLVLNQWLISLFGVDPLADGYERGKRPFHMLVEQLRTTREGLDADGYHHFYHVLAHGDFFRPGQAKVTEAELLKYEQNIVTYTTEINARRPVDRQIRWKYFQWLSLVFTEVYLDRYFGDRDRLLADLNAYVAEFNAKYDGYQSVSAYAPDDLNKVCFQNATGSGKTLLMHVNLKQFKHYANAANKMGDIGFPFLITPNVRLSEQHRTELLQSGITGVPYTKGANGVELGDFAYTLEIQKIQNDDGPETVAARNLGNNNLLLVDEGHAGLSGDKEKTVWWKYRKQLCEKGFAFEYSATFAQAVTGTRHEDEYAKAVLFDYSYRWFYEDGYGKDYQIYNLPKALAETQFTYLTGCLLKYYQQLRIYEERKVTFNGFNLQKPLWVFVGSTVSGGKKMTDSDKATATDVALIIAFVAEFLRDEGKATDTIASLINMTGMENGMLDAEGHDLFHGAFSYLAAKAHGDADAVRGYYRDIVRRVFNGVSSGKMQIERLKGGAGEILLRAPLSDANRPFGLINVGSPKELCDHLKTLPKLADQVTFAEDSDVTDPIFQTVRESSSPVNLLIGSKKFVEGWDCWRVSTLGLMHVGRSEGSQIIQLFGRGVRLIGWEWCLKRSSRSSAPVHPKYIHELELLNVFGIEADFMMKFREYLKSEGLPGNQAHAYEKIPMNITYDFGRKLKVVRPKTKRSDGSEYDFKKDAPVPCVGMMPKYLIDNKVVSDWYPRIQSVVSKSGAAHESAKNKAILGEEQTALLDYTELYFDLERFKRDRTWYNVNVTEQGIREILSNTDWYELYIPEAMVSPTTFAGVRTLQAVAAELLKLYVEKLYRHCKQQFIDPRLEVRELNKEDGNIPNEDDEYVFGVDAEDETLINDIRTLRNELADKKDELVKCGGIEGLFFTTHLYNPIFHLQTKGKVTVMPLSLNDSEFKFVNDLAGYVKANKTEFQKKGRELFLLRNLSRGKGVGFAEASNFHPDFILWMVEGKRQYLTFVEPHGLIHESPNSDKVTFFQRVKEIERRLGDPDLVLNSFILSPTAAQNILWQKGLPDTWYDDHHVLFLEATGPVYLKKLFELMR